MGPSPARAAALVLLAPALLAPALLGACSTARAKSGQEASVPRKEGEPARVKRLEVSPGTVVRRACTPSGPELCFNAVDDNCNGIIDEGCGVQTGLVQFAVAWDAPEADVDLNVTDPDGELVEAGRPTASGLVKDRDCPGRQNECHGQNMENVFLQAEKELPRGSYRVRVRLEKLGDEEPPILVIFGARVGPKTYSAEVTLERPEEEVEIVLEL